MGYRLEALKLLKPMTFIVVNNGTVDDVNTVDDTGTR